VLDNFGYVYVYFAEPFFWVALFYNYSCLLYYLRGLLKSLLASVPDLCVIAGIDKALLQSFPQAIKESTESETNFGRNLALVNKGTLYFTCIFWLFCLINLISKTSVYFVCKYSVLYAQLIFFCARYCGSQTEWRW
jgi:hypothetical protein